MKVFTIEKGVVTEGARVENLHLKGAGIDIPVIKIGEEGRGRRLEVVAVAGKNAGEQLMFAEIGQTKSGKPKLLAREEAGTDEKIIVVFRTPIGFRGGNSHTGDRIGWSCASCRVERDEEVPKTCPRCGALDGGTLGPKIKFAPFPGEIIAQGVIAQGDAGNMGSGDQLVAVMLKGVVFSTGYTGRLYGAPLAHYYMWDGKQLLSATWEEWQVADLF